VTGRFEVTEQGGFTITEEVRFSSGVKRDFDKAVELLEEGDHERGIELLEGVVAAAPEATMAYIDLGIAYRLTENYERAASSIERALEFNPRHPVGYNELGIVYRKMGRFDEARESYEHALAIYPAYHHARGNLAILCDVYIGDSACAIEHYELYAEMVPEDEKVGMWIKDLRNRNGE
jgi:tetratricopeptide (TPR) repeat protein